MWHGGTHEKKRKANLMKTRWRTKHQLGHRTLTWTSNINLESRFHVSCAKPDVWRTWIVESGASTRPAATASTRLLEQRHHPELPSFSTKSLAVFGLQADDCPRCIRLRRLSETLRQPQLFSPSRFSSGPSPPCSLCWTVASAAVDKGVAT